MGIPNLIAPITTMGTCCVVGGRRISHTPHEVDFFATILYRLLTTDDRVGSWSWNDECCTSQRLQFSLNRTVEKDLATVVNAFRILGGW